MRAASVLVILLAAIPSAAGQSLTGVWEATVTTSAVEVPFRIEFTGQGSNIKGWFFNGDERYESTSGTFENGTLVLHWDYYNARLEAMLKDGALEGRYERIGRVNYPFRARRYAPAPAATRDVPQIAGQWELHEIKSTKGESAWRLLVRQAGAEVSASILRVDGDTGTLSGSYRGDKFVLSHFSGVRPALLELTPAGERILHAALNRQDRMVALRPGDARFQGLPAPTDPALHTRVKDPQEPFRFSFPDLSGRIVSERDARFRGKVVLVNITGSWCPNCHDEAPFLAELYRTYRSRGLEIVGLSFEEKAQLENPTRLRAFIKRYGIEYTMLLAGETDEAKDKLPQAVNWNAFPTTFFLGRDGRVRSVHAGFPSAASGDLHTRAKQEFTDKVERLLAEAPVTSSTSARP
jgi:peroxiredoxin